MRHHTTLLLAILGAGCYSMVSAQYYSPLYSDNGIPWRGIEGPRDLCPTVSNYSFAYALDFKFDDLNDLDNVGGNGVKLFCRSDEGTVGYISSSEGKRGVWQGIRSCPFGKYFNGFRLRVFPEQGTWGDDFAVDNIQLSCSDGTIVDGMEGVMLSPQTPMSEQEQAMVERERVEVMGHMMEEVRAHQDGSRIHGEWGNWTYCSPDHFITGIRTVIEEGHIDDDAGLTDVILYCLLE